MSIQELVFSQPFFRSQYVEKESSVAVTERTIVLNLSEQPLGVQQQVLQQFESVMIMNTQAVNVERAIFIDGLDKHPDDAALLAEVKKVWPLVYDVRKEERLKGVFHYISPREFLDGIELNLYLAGSVPLNVGLHKEHYGGVPLKEVHTQIVGFGKMQQCTEKDLATLYWEEFMAPGNTHRPMFDENGQYPWHQFETITESIFMAVEVQPEAK